MGPSGWLGLARLDLKATRKVDWDEVGELIDASFRMVAPEEAHPTARRSLTRARIGHGSIGAMSFASPFPDVDIPTASVYEYLFGNIDEADADRIALVDAKSGSETSYREMVARIDAFAGALADRGIGVGDVVGLLAPNSSAFAIAFHGILRAGATATTINVLFTAKDIVKQLTDSKAKMLITVSAAAAPGQGGRRGGGHVRRPAGGARRRRADGQRHPNAADLLGRGVGRPRR